MYVFLLYTVKFDLKFASKISMETFLFRKNQGSRGCMFDALGAAKCLPWGESTIQCFNLQPKRQGFPGPSAPASRPAVDQRPRVVYFAERPNDLHQSHFFWFHHVDLCSLCLGHCHLVRFWPRPRGLARGWQGGG